jgi:hypothetical protein
MRYLLSCYLAVAMVTGCKNNDQRSSATVGNTVTDSTQFTTILWLDSTRNFGKIPEGQKLEVSFRFKNTGVKPLVIESVQPSCGCTVVEQSREPVAPGGEGRIKASFNSQGHVGVNHKSLSVYANTKGGQNHTLQFEVEVEKKQQ